MGPHPTRPAALAGGLLLAALAAAPAAADSNEYSAMVHVEVSQIVGGGSTTLVARSPRIGATVALLTDGATGFFDLGAPLPLLSLPPTLQVLAVGAIGADGTFSFTAPSPGAGVPFYVQALAVDPAGRFFASNRPGAVLSGPVAPALVEATTSLPGDTSLFSSTDVDFADLNRDGCPDAVVGSDSGPGSEPLILIGDCDEFSSEGAFRLPAAARRPAACVEIGDVNGDGFPDLFLGGGSNPTRPLPNLLLVNDGTGFFELALPGLPKPTAGPLPDLRSPCTQGRCFRLPEGLGYAVDAEFGDVDGDGDLDLLVISVQDFEHPQELPDPVVLYRNQGGLQGGFEGDFVEDQGFSTIPGNQPHAANGDVSLADVDGDADLDLFVCSVGIQNQLFVNDGSGVFTEVTATALPAEVDDSFEADFGDFDGDGDLDIVVANNIATDPSAIHYYRNETVTPDAPVFADGSGAIPASLGLVTNVRLATDVGDLDGDGDLDLVMGIHQLPGGPNGLDGETVLLLNQGGAQGGTAGTFAVDPAFVPGLFIVADVALADVDADGDLDLYIASSGDLFQLAFRDELWINE